MTAKVKLKKVYRMYDPTTGEYYGKMFQVKKAAVRTADNGSEIHTFALVRYEEPQLELEV